MCLTLGANSAMVRVTRATDFECKHPLLLHQIVVLAAFSTYLIDPDNIFWRFIKNDDSNARSLERSVFALVTLLFGIAAGLCTASRVNSSFKNPGLIEGSIDSAGHNSSRNAGHLGELLYAVALGCLAPLAGFVILLAGEAVRIVRLALRDRGDLLWPASSRQVVSRRPATGWTSAFRAEAIKWGIFLTMIVFTITLKDRIAEVLIGVSVLTWTLLNLRLNRGSLTNGL